VPTLVPLLGLRLAKDDVGTSWAGVLSPESAWSAPVHLSCSRPVPDSYIRTELARPDGWRLFHSYYRPRPSTQA
jgi:hypothetical protein